MLELLPYWLPLCVAYVLTQYYVSSKYIEPKEYAKLPFIVTICSLSPSPIISSVLSDLKILNSELGRLGLLSALVSETINIAFAFVVGFCNNMANVGRESESFWRYGIRSVVRSISRLHPS
ncbi:hypothetical protein K1719_040456 [Acacia pycnantha]|nr:hypothetical protein K1719_040456 [Acacia pycnantha]